MNLSLPGKDAGAVGGLSSGLYDDARGETKGEVINIVQDKDGKGGGGGNEGTFINMFHCLVQNVVDMLIISSHFLILSLLLKKM